MRRERVGMGMISVHRECIWRGGWGGKVLYTRRVYVFDTTTVHTLIVRRTSHFCGRIMVSTTAFFSHGFANGKMARSLYIYIHMHKREECWCAHDRY